MTKIPYAICRTEKLHFQDLNKASAHNFRDKAVPNADESKTILPMLGCASGEAFVSEIKRRFESWKERKLEAKAGKRGAKMAHDPVVCVEVLLTASPEYFRPENPDQAGHWRADRLEAWKKTIAQFATSYFGDNLVSVILHLDEATPHAHCLCMPFDQEGNLNAKRLFNRANLIKLQDAYAQACKPLGLQRGLRGSQASHEDIKDFYGLVNRETPQITAKQLNAKAIELPGKVERLSDETMQAFAESAYQQGAKAAAKLYEEKLEVVSAKADAYDLARRREDEASLALSKARKLASDVRIIPLEEVLQKLGAVPDANQINHWLMPGRSISVNGSKFFDPQTRKGGGGAIDLVKYLEGVDYTRAVEWLALEFGKAHTTGEAIRAAHEVASSACDRPQPLPVPDPVPENLPRVVDYLVNERHIPQALVDSLTAKGTLYADRHANCVFQTKTTDGQQGAELRGTTGVPFHGNRGRMGTFLLAPKDRGSKEAVFVKSAIDALSYRTLHPLCGWVFSVAGQVVRQVRKLARELIQQGYKVIAAFGKSAEGPLMSIALMDEGAAHRELPPSGGDWSDELTHARQPSEVPAPVAVSKLSLFLK